MTRTFLHDRFGAWTCAAASVVSLLPALLGGPVSARLFAARGGEDPTTLLARAAAWLAVALVLWVLLQVVAGVRLRSAQRPLRLADAAVALAPWALATASVLLTGSRAPSPFWLAVPAVIVALVIAQPDIRVLKVLGGVTIGLAALAVVVGLVNPEFASFLPYGDIGKQFDKAIFGTLLSWPFVHPNGLGTSLVLGAPFVLYLRSTWVKAVGLMIIAGGVMWTSSRSAIYAGIVVLVVAALLRAVRPSARAAVLRWGAVALIGAVVATPLLTTDPEAFTQRGQIWQASLQRVGQAPLLGHGHFWYIDIGRFAPDLFWDATSGHNLMVHTLLTGGIVGLAVIGWLLVRLVRAIDAYARAGDVVPGLFVLTWLTISIIEALTEASIMMHHSWFVTLLPLIVILVGARPPSTILLADGGQPPSGQPRAAHHPMLAPDGPTPPFTPPTRTISAHQPPPDAAAPVAALRTPQPSSAANPPPTSRPTARRQRQERKDHPPMQLADFLRLLRTRWLSIALLTILGTLAGLGATAVATPSYSAHAQLFVSARGSDTASDLLQGSTFTAQRVRSYVGLVQSPRVLQPVIDDLGLSGTPSDLARRVTADNPLETVLINVSVEDTSPEQAAAIANAVAASLSDVVQQVETPAGETLSPVQLSIVRSATEPTAPSSPNIRMNLALGLLVGLGLGVGVAVLREVLDTRVRTISDVEALSDAAVLGALPGVNRAKDRPLVLADSAHSLHAEAFRRLRTNLQFLEVDGNARAIVFTSALRQEGKSTTAINLARTLAEAGTRVALVDADLRRPSVARYLGLEGSVGLSTLLIGRASLDDVTQPYGTGNLDVITSGQVPPNPSELLGSDRMSDLLDELNDRYDIVLIDTAPLLAVTDGAILARQAGGAVLVVGAGRVHRQQLHDALRTLETVNARVLGIVVNRVRFRGGRDKDGYTYYEYAGGHAPDQTGTPAHRDAKVLDGSRAAEALQEPADPPATLTISRRPT